MFWLYLVGGIVLVKALVLIYAQWRTPYPIKGATPPMTARGERSSATPPSPST